MSGLNWAAADAATVACLSTEFIQAELDRRGMDTTGSREDLIRRLAELLEGARAASSSEAIRPASAPVSSAGVQFLAAPPTPAIEQAASRLYRPASPVLQFTYTSQPLAYNAAPQERFSPPRETLPFVTTPGFPADRQYPQPQYGVPFSPSSPPAVRTLLHSSDTYDDHA
ncbi:hypothetical protein MTO96_048686 [Rhipicephalus appendiculatus]